MKSANGTRSNALPIVEKRRVQPTRGTMGEVTNRRRSAAGRSGSRARRRAAATGEPVRSADDRRRISHLAEPSPRERELPLTIGQALDLLPFAVFMHVFLAFPSGRLRGPPGGGSLVRRISSPSASDCGDDARRLQSGERPHDHQHPDAGRDAVKIQLTALAAIALVGIGLLVARRRRDGPPLRRSSAVLVDSFMLALLMIAVLVRDRGLFPTRAPSSRSSASTFFVVGLAPLAFLVALLDARLARSSVGDLLVELRAEPAPERPARAARPGAARPVAERSPTGCRSTDAGPTRTGSRSSCPAPTTARADDA